MNEQCHGEATRSPEGDALPASEGMSRYEAIVHGNFQSPESILAFFSATKANRDV